MKRIVKLGFPAIIFLCFLMRGQADAVSLYFDGNDYVTLPSNISPANITIESWFYFTALALDPSWNPIINKCTGSGAAEDFAWRIGMEGTSRTDRAPAGSIVFQVSNTTNTAFIHSNTIPSLNEWYHVAGTYDGSTLRLYVNGVLEAEGADTYSHAPSWTGGDLNQLPLPTGIGHLINWDIQGFQGNIDELRIWSTDRNEQQILDNKDFPLNGDQSGLLAYWDFEPDVDPDVLYDVTSNNFDGTIYGATRSTNSAPLVPEPSTIFLIGSGLAGLAGLRRKARKG